jgi:hypothetical protein
MLLIESADKPELTNILNILIGVNDPLQDEQVRFKANTDTREHHQRLRELFGCDRCFRIILAGPIPDLPFIIAGNHSGLVRKVDSQQNLSHRQHFLAKCNPVAHMPRGQYLMMSRWAIFKVHTLADRINYCAGHQIALRFLDSK